MITKIYVSFSNITEAILIKLKNILKNYKTKEI